MAEACFSGSSDLHSRACLLKFGSIPGVTKRPLVSATELGKRIRQQVERVTVDRRYDVVNENAGQEHRQSKYLDVVCCISLGVDKTNNSYVRKYILRPISLPTKDKKLKTAHLHISKTFRIQQ